MDTEARTKAKADSQSGKPKATLRSEKRGGTHRPVIHVLMPDGRVSEFKGRGIVIPDADNEGAPDQQVCALLVNGNGEPYVTPDGELAMTPVPVVGLEVLADPNKLVTFACQSARNFDP